MINLTVVKETIHENLTQPFFLFAALIELTAVFLFSFGIELRYENEVLTGLGFFGRMIEDQVYIMSREFLRSFSGILVYFLMFLFIIGGSATHLGMLQSPLTAVILTKPVSRSVLFLSKFLGLWILVTVLVLAFSVILWCIAFYKSSGNMPTEVLLAPLSFSLEFGVIFAFSAFTAMLVENQTGVSILSLIVYFYVGRMAGNFTLPPVVHTLSLLLPPTGAMNFVTLGSILSGGVDFSVFLRGLPYVIISLGAGVYLFHRKDLR